MSDEEYRAALLDFLTDGLFGRERDAVTRSIFDYAEGDPRSQPVGMAVLLTASARQMARLPENVRSRVTELQALLEKLAQVENDLAGKSAGYQRQFVTDLRDASSRFIGGLQGEASRAVTAFETENMRAEACWKQAVQELRQILEEAERSTLMLAPVVASARAIVHLFESVKVELVLREAADQRVLDVVESLKVIHQENKEQGQETQVLLKSLTKEARANWISMGYLIGIFLAALFYHLPWWGTWASFISVLVLLQWVSRSGWKFKSMLCRLHRTLLRRAKS